MPFGPRAAPFLLIVVLAGGAPSQGAEPVTPNVGAEATAEAAPSLNSVYQVSPVTDGAIIGVTALGSLLPYLNASNLIHPRCPCDPQEINAVDRPVVGNSNES